MGKAMTWSPFVRTCEQGARISIKVATDPSMKDVTGRFITSTRAAELLPAVKWRKDGDLQRALWDRTAGWVGL
jgi:hypothetical protein